MELSKMTSKIGFVLSGGGAKGAYQAGVWKALVETGVAKRITAISGTIHRFARQGGSCGNIRYTCVLAGIHRPVL